MLAGTPTITRSLERERSRGHSRMDAGDPAIDLLPDASRQRPVVMRAGHDDEPLGSGERLVNTLGMGRRCVMVLGAVNQEHGARICA